MKQAVVVLPGEIAEMKAKEGDRKNWCGRGDIVGNHTNSEWVMLMKSRNKVGGMKARTLTSAISFETADLMLGDFPEASMTVGTESAHDDELLMLFYDMISDSE